MPFLCGRISVVFFTGFLLGLLIVFLSFLVGGDGMDHAIYENTGDLERLSH